MNFQGMLHSLTKVLLMIQCSRIYYRLGGIIATEHYEQIADHGSLLVVIKLYHIFIAQFLQSVP